MTIDAAKPKPLRPALQRPWSLIRRSPLATIGALVLGFWCVVALAAPWAAPYSFSEIHPALVGNPYPTLAHPLGTDYLGRDMLSRLMWGARTVLTVAPIAVLAAMMCGAPLGLMAGYFGGWIDTLIMRIGDVMLAFPLIILYLLVISIAGASVLNIILVIAITKAPIIARITRAVAIDILRRDFVAAARMRGESALFIMFVEVLPHARGPLLVDGFLRLGYTTIAIGALGFLGLGLPPPNPDWGGMVKESYAVFYVWPHVPAIPAIAIASLVIACNFLATGMREVSQRG